MKKSAKLRLTFFIILYNSLSAIIAQLVERSHGKGEVTGSIPVNGSICIQKRFPQEGDFFGKIKAS